MCSTSMGLQWNIISGKCSNYPPGNVYTIENDPFSSMVHLSKIAVFHGCVKLPDEIRNQDLDFNEGTS